MDGAHEPGRGVVAGGWIPGHLRQESAGLENDFQADLGRDRSRENAFETSAESIRAGWVAKPEETPGYLLRKKTVVQREATIMSELEGSGTGALFPFKEKLWNSKPLVCTADPRNA